MKDMAIPTRKLNSQQVQYKTLEVYDSAKKNGFKFEDIAEYWGQAKTDIG